MRRFRTLTAVLALEALAFALAALQLPGGLKTDEAKYLLSIPYPHPPLLRSLMAATSAMPMHEFFWRVIMATLMVQAVWLIMDLCAVLSRQRRICLAACWLLSSAVILQAGTIMLVVPTAFFGLVFLWFAIHPKPSKKTGLLALLWLASLFTAYQSFLYAPLVFVAMLRSRKRRFHSLLLFLAPVALLVLYTLSNPLALASMANVSTQDTVVPMMQRLSRIGWIWIVAGGGLMSLTGTVGVLMSSRWSLVASFGLVLGYIVLTSQHYYAILLTPLFVGGVFLLLCKRRLKPELFVAFQVVCSAAVLSVAWIPMHPTAARATVRALQAHGVMGPILIDGPFGHEWEYESPSSVLRFSQSLSADAESKAQAFVCTKGGGCDEDINLQLWTRVPDMPEPVWVKK